jgi:hypothetical protein
MYSTTWQTITTLLKKWPILSTGGCPDACQLLYCPKALHHHQTHPPRKYGGRPAKVTPQDRRHLARKVTSGAASTAAELKKSLDLDVCVQTIRNMLKKEGLRSAVKARKPFLSRHHRKARLELLWSTRTGPWMTGLGSFGQMRVRLIG